MTMIIKEVPLTCKCEWTPSLMGWQRTRTDILCPIHGAPGPASEATPLPADFVDQDHDGMS